MKCESCASTTYIRKIDGMKLCSACTAEYRAWTKAQATEPANVRNGQTTEELP